MVNEHEIYNGIRSLQIPSGGVVVHSSLRSFGRLQNGPTDIIKAVESIFPLVMMPGFQCAANRIIPPPEFRPSQNGCDYEVHFQLDPDPQPFDVRREPIHPKMGQLCHAFAKSPGVLRSNHPWHSWLIWGNESIRYANDHPWQTTNRPLENLAASGGWMLLLGVTIASCTAIHIAEERAGRRPFVRWALDESRQLCEVAVSGCGKGFINLLPTCKHLLRYAEIGPCLVAAAPLEPLIQCCATAIRNDPRITVCSGECLRCHDASLGGPTYLNR